MEKEKAKMIIAIDGPAGAGKSTIARMVAKRLNILYIDTGAMYRAVTYLAIEKKFSFQNEMDKITKMAGESEILLKEADGKYLVFINGKNVTEEIRTPEVTKNISYIASNPDIREIMVKMQQKLGEKGGVILEGRDIQTVVFPNADYKIYLDASPEERADRRLKDFEKKGNKNVSFNDVLKSINERDHSDKNREAGPLKMAEDAIYLDTTKLSIEEVVEKILQIINKNEIS
ncbi:MAG: (d)CMP kinase [bacterium]|nr:(d)CMP kinase [bacterium]